MSAELAHDRLGGILRSLANVGRGVAERGEEDGKDLADVGLEEASQDGREDLVSEDGALTSVRALLVLSVVAEATENAKLLKARQSTSLDDSSQTIRCPTTFGVLGSGEEVRHELVGERRDVVLDDFDERREAVTNGGLNDLRRRAKSLD